MNKNELVSVMSNKSGLTKTDAMKALDSFIEAVGEALSKKDEIRLIGFGTFYTSDRAATVGRNPQTGAQIKIAATTLPKFKAGKVLKDTVSSSKK